MTVTGLGPVIALTMHPRSSDEPAAFGPFPSQAEAADFCADQIERGEWDPAVEVHYAELDQARGWETMRVSPQLPHGTLELHLASPCTVVYDGRDAVMLYDSTQPRDVPVASLSSIQRAVTIARLRAYADLLEQAGKDLP